MTAGVSPVSPVVHGTPSSRTSYDASPISPAVQKATCITTTAPPSMNDSSMTTPRQPPDVTQGVNLMA
jgi:hypothetical protein